MLQIVNICYENTYITSAKNKYHLCALWLQERNNNIFNIKIHFTSEAVVDDEESAE